MDSARLIYLFRRYVDDACTVAEKEEFLKIVSDSCHDDQLAELMSVLWCDHFEKGLPSDRREVLLQKILNQRGPGHTKRQGHVAFFQRVAASLLLILLSGAALFFFTDERVSDLDTSRASVDQTQPGFVRLPDGSTVILNGASKLYFPSAFDDDVREVTLTGEGFFDIAHDSKRPFVVHTGNLRTTVLGTAFNIKAYPEHSDITVTVTRGKVSVSDDRQVFGIVNPDEQITFYKSQATAEQKGVDSHEVTSWMEKDIYFDDVTIAEAVDQLEKRFGARIILENSNVGSCRFTATFVKGEDLSQILRIVCDFNNATLLTNDDHKFFISGGACPL